MVQCFILGLNQDGVGLEPFQGCEDQTELTSVLLAKKAILKPVGSDTVHAYVLKTST